MLFKVKQINGCGDHTVVIVEAKDKNDALEKALQLDFWVKEWEDITIELFDQKLNNYPDWLKDSEIYNHEEPYYLPRY